MIGRTLGHYRIEAKLGEGGMGVVYKALDTHLDRSVAIKVLPPEAVSNPERKRRFVQEAKAASALNHPNILHIYDIDSTDGVDFIAMEYVAGKTLDELIGRNGLKLAEALRYTVQIADALAAAHAAGIVHRDIKPSNIMVSEKGLVRVLDFGLAKLVEQVKDDSSAPTETMGPRTEEGAIVGTVAYMSPEQAQGLKVDARSDIFSFGSVLYEMMTGRRPFTGDSRLSILSMILKEDPALPSELAPSIPPELEKIILRCLRKDLARRYQTMADLKVALEDVQEESVSGRLAAALPRRRRAAAVWTAGVLLVASVAAALWWKLHTPAPRRGVELVRVTADDGLTAYPAVSGDGKLLAYASDRAGNGNLDIWLQQVGGGNPLCLTRDPADESEPAFSADATRIVFRSERLGGGIYVISTLGGEPQRVADHGRTPRFSPDGRWIAYWTGEPNVFGRNRLYVAPSNGGEPRHLAADFFSAYFPLWSPDGQHLLFLGARDAKAPVDERYEWWVIPLDGGSPINTGGWALLRRHRVTPVHYSPSDWFGDNLVFSGAPIEHRAAVTAALEANLWHLKIPAGTWRAAGLPERLTFGTGVEVQPAVGGGQMGVYRLALTNMAGNPDLWSLPVDANQGKALGPMRRLTSNIATDYYCSVSGDGKRIAFISDRLKDLEVFLRDLDTGKETALTSSRLTKFGPAISADGSQVAYYVFERDKTPGFSFYIVGAGGGASKKVCEGCDGPFSDWSPDQNSILYRKRGAGGPDYVVSRNLESGREATFLKHTTYGVTAARLSGDGRWTSFQTVIDQMRRQIFVTRLQNGVALGESAWIPITDGSGPDRNAVWSPDGNLLYFLSERDGSRCFWAQRLDPISKRPVGRAFEVQPFHQVRRSLMPQGEVAAIGLSVARDKLVFSMGERTGNIWMTELQGQE